MNIASFKGSFNSKNMTEGQGTRRTNNTASATGLNFAEKSMSGTGYGGLRDIRSKSTATFQNF